MDNSRSNHKDDNKIKKNKYIFDTFVGAGSFGEVFKAQNKDTDETVAIKKVFQDKKYKNRELSILKSLNHPNVIKLREYFYTHEENSKEVEGTEDVYLNVVMDYIPDTMSRVIRNFYKNKKEIPYYTVKLFSYQLLRSIGYIHSKGICHRDIKPQNILVDLTNSIVKLCDFGSAKKLNPQESNVSYICSRYYRAPELIFNSIFYTNSVDVWSIGCVIVELVLGLPIFQGECSVDQIVEIIKMLGTPSKKEILEMNPNYTEYKFPIIKCFTWRQILGQFKNIDDMYIDLITKLLTYSPTKRYTPFEALAHPYFDSLREEGTKNKELDDILFNFSEDEKNYGGNIVNKLVPKWFHK